MEFDTTYDEAINFGMDSNCSQWNCTDDNDIIQTKWIDHLYKTTPIVLTVNLIILMLGMGSASNFFDVWDVMKKPGKLFIGSLCQCVMLPVLGFGLVLYLDKIPSQQALGIIILICSPSGALSNFFTFWMNGDLALSIVLTAVSGFLAFMTMPLVLWIFVYFITEENVVIPYKNIAIGVAFVTIPCVLGMTIRHFKRKYAILLTKFSSVFGLLGVLFIGIMLALTHWSVLVSTNKIALITAAILPIIFFSGPFIIARTCCMSNKVSRTIGICCSCQNFTVAMNLFTMSFISLEERNEALTFPILYLIFHKIELFIVLVTYQVYKFSHRHDVIEEDVVSVVDTKLLHRISFPNHTSFTSLLKDSNRQFENLQRSRNQSPSQITKLNLPETHSLSALNTTELDGLLNKRTSLYPNEILADEYSTPTIRLSDLESRVANDVLHRTYPSNHTLYDMAPYTPIYVFNSHDTSSPIISDRYEFKTFGEGHHPIS